MLPVFSTGIRDGEFIQSHNSSPQTKGSIIQVKGFYPPSSFSVKELSLTDIRDKLTKIGFFKEMSVDEAKKYLNDTSVDSRDLYISDMENLQVKYISLGGSVINRLSEKQKNILLDGNYHPINEVSEMFNKPGSTGKRANMVFRGNNWSVMSAPSPEKKFKGVLITIGDEETTTEMYNGKINTNVVSILPSNDVAIQVGSTSPCYTLEDIDEILSEYKDSPAIQRYLYWASPSVHKSLIQKSIRTRCESFEYLTDTFRGEDVLVTSFLMLVQHPGKFDPELKNYESGLMSALKRSGVSIAEDSNVKEASKLLSLFASAYYCRSFKDWKPTAKMLMSWIDTLLEARSNTGVYLYKFDEVYVKTNTNPLNLCYHVLEATRALPMDMPMVGWIAKNKGALNPDHDQNNHITVPLYHCIDHHNITDIAWFADYSSLTTYRDYFRKVWDESSRANGRKRNQPLADDTENDFVRELRFAQMCVWILRCHDKLQREPVKNKVFKMQYKLDKSWIAGLIGVVTFTVNRRKIHVVVDSSDITSYKLIPEQRRGEKTPYQITDDDDVKVTEAMDAHLKSGVKVAVPPSLDNIYKSLTVKMKDGDYLVNGKPWDKFSKLKMKIPVCESIKDDDNHKLMSVIYSGMFVEDDLDKKIVKAVNLLDDATQSRLLTYIGGVTTTIEMNKISRDGSPVKGVVIVEDTAVYSFLCYLSCIAPCAIEPRGSKFVVKNGPLMWYITDIIRTTIYSAKSSQNPKSKNVWKFKENNELVLYQHQAEAIHKMKDGNRHIMYITPGLGKTLIVIRYIMWLVNEGKMADYCVYTLPTSAYEGVMKQFKDHGFKINKLDMRKTSTNAKIKPKCINFIFHDHLRKGDFSAQAGDICNNLMLIVDEFHLTMAATQRTHHAIALATISRYMIALTGTLITDSNLPQLIAWLKLVSKFEVTESNYWVAVGGLISSRIETKIPVTRRNIHINLTPREKEEHDKSFDDAVRVCYEVVQKRIVSETLKYISTGVCVFIVARNSSMQKELENKLTSEGVKRIHLITKDTPIDYQPGDKRRLQVIITTIRQSTGYTITGMYTMITSVYFSNQATRDQLDARLNRIGQNHDVEIITVHCGLLSYILQRYDKVRSLSEAMKAFAAIVDVAPKETN